MSGERQKMRAVEAMGRRGGEMRGILIVALAVMVSGLKAQGAATMQGAGPAFEVATIKPTALDAKAG
jgi:hypothetical protein